MKRKNLVEKVRGMRIVNKMISGYIFLIGLPMFLFGFIFYNQLYHNYYIQYLNSQQRLLEQAESNMAVELNRTEAAYQLFEDNNYLLEYLEGKYLSDAERIYTFRRDIDPTFMYTLLGNSLIKRVNVYAFNSEIMPLPPDIENMENLKNGVPIDRLKPDTGLWTYQMKENDQLPELSYYHKIYNSPYTKQLGIIEITMNSEILTRLENTLLSEKNSEILLVDQSDKILFHKGDYDLSPQQIQSILNPSLNKTNYYIDGHDWMINSLPIQELNLRMIRITKMSSVIGYLRIRERWSIVLGIIMLFVLSVVYYFIVSTFTKRIIGLSRHMKNIGDHNFSAYQGNSGGDEIGYLIKSFNRMIGRIDNLVNRVHRVEMLKKEADFKMLQAQIQPHFLYNTLETIRGCAEINDDIQVADMAYHLGRFFRYSLSKSADDSVTLSDEIDHLLDYIAIYKVRMRDRLDFRIALAGDASSFLCPRFILQPLVENSLIHGLSIIRQKGQIRLDITELRKGFHIVISDNGIGIEADKLNIIRELLSNGSTMHDRSMGIGIYNVYARASEFYHGNCMMSVSSKPGAGTTIEFYLGNRGA